MTQRQRMALLFESRPNDWIPLTVILDMRISQYGRVICELRSAGMEIENRTQMVDGQKRSWFRLVRGQREFELSA